MKAITSALEDHLEQEVTTLASCWELIRVDGTTLYFTDHDRDIEFNGNTYESAYGYARTAVANDSSMSVDNLDLVGILDSNTITEEQLRSGLYDYAEIRVFIVNWDDLSQGELKIRRGWLGEVMLMRDGTFKAELRGMSQVYQQRIGELYSPECRVDLGDARCGVPAFPDYVERDTAYDIDDVVRVVGINNISFRCTTAGTTDTTLPTYNTVGNTTDGTAVFTAEESWVRFGTVDAVTDRRSFESTVTEARAVDGWFDLGVLRWLTGNNAGKNCEVSSWTQTDGVVTLFLPLYYDIQVGDTFEVFPGCNKRVSTCNDKFDNVINFRGEPYVPGQDAYFSYPDAK